MSKKTLGLVVGALVLALPGVLLAQGRTQAEPRARAAFISHVEGDVFFQEKELAELDMIVTQGDELITQTGRAEIDLGKGNWIRLDENTQVKLTSLQKDSVKLSVERGNIYLHLESKDAEVATPTQTFHPEYGLARIEVEKNKAKMYANPRVVDQFDRWNARLERSEGEPYEGHEGRYGYGSWYGGYGGWRSRFGLGWGWDPYSYWGGSPYSFWYWPSFSYFGYPAWMSFYSPYSYGFGRYGYGFRFGRSTVHKGQLQSPRLGRSSYRSGHFSGSHFRGTTRSTFSRPSIRISRRH